MTDVQAGEELSQTVRLAQALIRLESVTPDRGETLDLLEQDLSAAGFICHRLLFEEEGSAPVPNLYARFGREAPNLCFAGHTDVVPVGSRCGWSVAPFAGVVRDGQLWGRGAADMKGAVAAFVTAARAVIAEGRLAGSLSLLITGDEEGPAINGTKKLLDWLQDRGERLDYCLVGEPTNPQALGDMIKIGRRGSLHGTLHVDGIQGHVAYPQRAHNPIPDLVKLVTALLDEPLDQGNAHFQPSNLEIVHLYGGHEGGHEASNVIPATARAHFNVRFSSKFTPERLINVLTARLDRVGCAYRVDWLVSGDSFLTPPGPLSAAVQDAVEAHTGRRPRLSTSGGTSDARFIRHFCPVVEFGLVGETMHQADERVAIADIDRLAAIYRDIIIRLAG